MLLLLVIPVVVKEDSATLQRVSSAPAANCSALFSVASCVGEGEVEPWSKEKLNLPVSCRSREMNERGPEARAAFVDVVAFAAEN